LGERGGIYIINAFEITLSAWPPPTLSPPLLVRLYHSIKLEVDAKIRKSSYLSNLRLLGILTTSPMPSLFPISVPAWFTFRYIIDGVQKPHTTTLTEAYKCCEANHSVRSAVWHESCNIEAFGFVTTRLRGDTGVSLAVKASLRADIDQIHVFAVVLD